MNFSGCQNDAAEHAALAVDVLGRGIDHTVGAELERALVERRGEHIVHHQLGAGVVGDVGDRGDVDHFQRRIGRQLQKTRLGVFLHRLLPGRQIGAVDQRRGDAEARQPFLDHPAAGTEQRLGRDHVIAGFHQPHQRGGDGRHAGGGRARGLGAFERGHALLEHGHGRVGIARIDVTRRLAGEARLALLGARIDIALGEEQRLRRLAELRAQRAGMNQLGFGAVGLLGRRGHVALLAATFVANKKPAGEKFSAGHTRPRPFSDLFYVAASRPAQMTTGLTCL